MSALPKLNSYKLFYEQISLPEHKQATPDKPGRKSAQLPQNVLDNI